jgi:hypothetical protein
MIDLRVAGGTDHARSAKSLSWLPQAAADLSGFEIERFLTLRPEEALTVRASSVESREV